MRALLVALSLLVVACAGEAPPCPFTGEAAYAPSAGCLAAVHGKVMVIENLNGMISPPGGKARPGESAQCAAHRETFEETGLDLMPGELLAVFDTGFHLYHCEIHARSGLIDPSILEARAGLWLDVEDFDKVKWRFPGQGETLYQLLKQE